jgi:outer membrane protein assembly factor BamB
MERMTHPAENQTGFSTEQRRRPMLRFSKPMTLIAVMTSIAGFAPAADWPMWGRDATHNAVSPEKNAPIDFQLVKAGRNVAWTAELGFRTIIPPVVADGLVWIGTNARDPDDEKIPSKDWDGGVLMCFRETDGKLLWKHRTPRLSGPDVDFMEDYTQAALGSVPLVEGDRLWYVNNRTEVVCLDIAPLKKGTGLPAEVWKLDMRKELGVHPYLALMHAGFAASVAGYKDKLYAVTHNGVDETRLNVPKHEAPSLVCLEKTTGKVLWKDNSPGKNIIDYQVSSPLVVEINGKPQAIVGQGDGWLRSFDANTGKLIWKCDLNPKDSVYELGGQGTRSYVVATPILYDNRVYIATGQDPEHYTGVAALYCIDPTKEGDVSRELEIAPKKGKPNPNSAVLWYTPPAVPDDAPRILVGVMKKRDLLRECRDFYYGRTIASCTARDGLVYAAELAGLVFCFDARTGTAYWVEDLKDSVWGQPLWVDGKVYVGTEGGDVFVFAHGKEKKQLAKIETNSRVRPGFVFANGTLYVTAEATLYAIRNPK